MNHQNRYLHHGGTEEQRDETGPSAAHEREISQTKGPATPRLPFEYWKKGRRAISHHVSFPELFLTTNGARDGGLPRR